MVSVVVTIHCTGHATLTYEVISKRISQICDSVGDKELSDFVDVSIIIPVLNEDESVEPLVLEIVESIDEVSYEIIFVDDGSNDATIEKLLSLRKTHNVIRILKLKRNHGKATALSAGFQIARGRRCVTMDGDLQDDPGEIGRFLSKMDEGFEIVCGWRAKRKDGIAKRLPSRIYNSLSRKIAKVDLHDMNCGFKAYDTELAQSLNLYGDMHRYTPVLGAINGGRITEILVNHRPRVYGYSKYGGKRLARGLFDLLTVGFLFSFMERPLHLFGRIGGFLSTAGFSVCAYLVFRKFAYSEGIGDRPLLMLGVLMIIIGVQLFMLGLLGETFVHNHSPNRRLDLIGDEI